MNAAGPQAKGRSGAPVFSLEVRDGKDYSIDSQGRPLYIYFPEKRVLGKFRPE